LREGGCEGAFGVRRFLIWMSLQDKTALLIVAHGSTVNPDSSAPTLAHAAEIRRRKIFADVECAFWKEEPSLRDAIFLFDLESIREVYVVPNFISEGYFTETVVPRELELNGRITKRSNGQVWKYCEPVGNHPKITDLLSKRAREVAPGVDPAETSLLIVAHGTDLNENSAIAAKREAEKIRSLGKYAAVLNVYMEEQPLVVDWRKLTQTPNVVVVPFFISDGLHSYQDIPVLLGIAIERSGSSSRRAGSVKERRLSSRRNHRGGRLGNRPSLMPHARGEIFRRNPYKIDDRSLFYAPSIGTDPGFADIIIEQAHRLQTATQAHNPRGMLAH
jgi:sirohydrochlorin cobaltochelatase